MITSLLLVLGAPAPLPLTDQQLEDRIRRAIVGVTWRMDWGGDPKLAEETRFEEDGRFSSVWSKALWVGQWRLKGSILTVREYPAGSPELYIIWSVVLDRSGVRGQMLPEVGGKRKNFSLHCKK